MLFRSTAVVVFYRYNMYIDGNNNIVRDTRASDEVKNKITAGTGREKTICTRSDDRRHWYARRI